MASDQHLSFKCFPETAFASAIFPNLSGGFGRSEWKWVNLSMLKSSSNN